MRLTFIQDTGPLQQEERMERSVGDSIPSEFAVSQPIVWNSSDVGWHEQEKVDDSSKVSNINFCSGLQLQWERVGHCI
jgi:hypothetical protein